MESELRFPTQKELQALIMLDKREKREIVDGWIYQIRVAAASMVSK